MINKKEIKRQYKEAVQPMGVFVITNIKSGRKFIGKTKNLAGKLNSIRFQLDMGSCMNKELQDDYNVLGPSGFIFEVLDTLKPEEAPGHDYTDDLNVLEAMWLDKLRPYGDKGYNKFPKQ